MPITNFMINHFISKMVVARVSDLQGSELIKQMDIEDPFNLYLILKGKKITLSKTDSYVTENGDFKIGLEVHDRGEIQKTEIQLKGDNVEDNTKLRKHPTKCIYLRVTIRQ